MMFEGRVRTLSQPRPYQPGKWLRREIIVRQDPATGYPKPGEKWDLIDLHGVSYVLKFISGAGVRGYGLLGQPAKLRPWFIARYPKDSVVKDYVFFEKLGDARFRLLSSEEWLSERGLKGSIRWSK